MKCCLICLESNSDEDLSSRITTQSLEWIEGNIQNVIEKHLWWWYLKPASKGCEQWICRNCWHEVSSFHDFYTKVERAHNNYQTLLTALKMEPNKFTDDMVCNFNDENDQHLLENSRKRGRGRPRKEEITVGTNVSEEILMVEIKTEISCGSYECTEEFNGIEVQSDQDYSEEIKNEISREERCTEVKHPIKATEKSSKKKSKNDELGDYKLECHICNVPLNDFRELKKHYQTEHNTNGYAMCCDRRFSKKNLLIDHLRVHKDPNYFKCPLCVKNFATRRGLEMHADAHKPRERIYNCEECGKSYFKQHIYERHKLIHVPENKRNFQCSQCEKKFATEYMRRQHVDVTHCKKYAKICEMCGKAFASRESFQRHMEQHAGVPLSVVTCDICGIKLADKSGLRKHITMRHTAENLKEQICPYCSKVSPNLNAHRMHIRFTHLMQRKHSCHMCDKSFKRAVGLKEHLSTHTGEALYKCPHCPRTFVSNANMHKHRKIVHRQEWEENRLKRFNGSREKTLPTLDAVENGVTEENLIITPS